MTSLRVSSPAEEGVYQGAKWLKFQVLCEERELRELFSTLAPFSLFPLTGLCDGKPIAEEVFLETYGAWVNLLRKGIVPPERAVRTFLAAALSPDLEALWLQEVPNKGYLVRVAKPLLQMQSAWFSYSSSDGQFRPMTLGAGAIFWGLQFSYPQVYQEAKTGEIKEIGKNPFFAKLRPWIRQWTRPVPFVVEGRRMNSSLRLGNHCFSWIHHHPQLKEQNIQVYASSLSTSR